MTLVLLGLKVKVRGQSANPFQNASKVMIRVMEGLELARLALTLIFNCNFGNLSIYREISKVTDKIPGLRTAGNDSPTIG